LNTVRNNGLVFCVGQRVELYSTIPSREGGSIESGRRGIVQAIEEGPIQERYLVAFMVNETLTSERAWLAAQDLLAV
jgi:hypothetical protein